MSDWNEQAAPNNNLGSSTLRTAKTPVGSKGNSDNKSVSNRKSKNGPCCER
ncbi:hypothetical protein [Peribacillus saganii]|uniref:hypothetical protein n=1 Tax=Peribacillus saganii TaxID=2303992 RepID=UPI001314249E|nr:hypothetical protein [Peribacillus saganii]